MEVFFYSLREPGESHFGQGGTDLVGSEDDEVGDSLRSHFFQIFQALFCIGGMVGGKDGFEGFLGFVLVFGDEEGGVGIHGEGAGGTSIEQGSQGSLSIRPQGDEVASFRFCKSEEGFGHVSAKEVGLGVNSCFFQAFLGRVEDGAGVLGDGFLDLGIVQGGEDFHFGRQACDGEERFLDVDEVGFPLLEFEGEQEVDSLEEMFVGVYGDENFNHRHSFGRRVVSL